MQRQESDHSDYPALACPAGDYQVSANDIEMQYKRLTSAPAKTCCKEGPRATEGTIINFIDRPAVVMELQQVTLDGVGEIRRSFFEHRALPFLVKSTASGDDTSRFSYAKRRRSQDKERLQRASAVDRMMLMVQVAEAVTWLHQEMNIVHKDLTPDNVMVNFGKERATSGQKRGREPVRLQDMLSDLITYPSFGVKVIDFGLADRGKLSHKWYEERDVNNAGVDKAPYFSPEALQRIQHLPPRTQIDVAQKRLVIPPEVWGSNLSVHIGDLITFQWDQNHLHDLPITRIEPGPDSTTRFAYFEGTPPPQAQHRQIQLVLPLVEAHDIYSVGALFYYIMTEDHQQVQRLSGLVNAIQTRPCDLNAEALMRRHGDGYIAYRDALPIPDVYWRDRVMEIVLRAMVRGRPDSYCSSRSQRGPEGALNLLWDTKKVYRGLQETILSEDRIRRFQVATIGMVAATMLVSLIMASALSKPKVTPCPPPVECAKTPCPEAEEPVEPTQNPVPPTPVVAPPGNRPATTPPSGSRPPAVAPIGNRPAMASPPANRPATTPPPANRPVVTQPPPPKKKWGNW